MPRVGGAEVVLPGSSSVGGGATGGRAIAMSERFGNDVTGGGACAYEDAAFGLRAAAFGRE